MERKEIIDRMINLGVTTDIRTGKTLAEILQAKSTPSIRLKVKRMAESGELKREKHGNLNEWKYCLGDTTRRIIVTNPKKVKKYVLLKDIESNGGAVNPEELKKICKGIKSHYYSEYIKSGELGRRETPLKQKTYYLTKKGENYLKEKDELFIKMSKLEGAIIKE